MTTLKNFLSTANSNHQLALEEARDYTETHGKNITSDVMTMLLVNNGLYAEFSDIANDTTSPARGIVMAFMDRVRTNSTFNFQSDQTKGQVNLQMVDILSQILTGLQAQINALRSAVINESAINVQPFSNTTLHDVLITREDCPVKAVTSANGWVTIDVSTDVEKHNPRLLAMNERTQEMVRVNNFRDVGVAGIYDCQVPREWLGASLFVDDVYGVI